MLMPLSFFEMIDSNIRGPSLLRAGEICPEKKTKIRISGFYLEGQKL